MSVQFGYWNFEGTPANSEALAKVEATIAPYGPDSRGCYFANSAAILHFGFLTTKESRRETQPHPTATGAFLTWDGRLDNRDELLAQLGQPLTTNSPDVAIVEAAYQLWGRKAFGNLQGDWALSLWDATAQSLLLAKDHMGSRHLYYSLAKDQVGWSSLLDPLVFFADRSFAISEEYLAGWLGYFPASHLTPYQGIYSVPPSSFVLLGPKAHLICKYWGFDPHKRVHYSADSEYEEHFRHLFRQAVRRTLRSDRPVLAELSGGRDSSAIVCVADLVLASGEAETMRLDTVSYYDDSEPNWNERPYFAKIEEKRGRTGCHIDISSSFAFQGITSGFACSPAALEWRGQESWQRLASCMTSGGNVVLLSGLGGDEFTGGVPAVEPELQDLLVTADSKALVHQLKLWALYRKRPWVGLLWEAIRGFLPIVLVGRPKTSQPLSCLNRAFVKRNREALAGYLERVKIFGPLPSFQENLSTIAALQRQIGCTPPTRKPLCERRYPFLDRDLLQFLFAIPREQLIRPGHSRSLMRRALRGIVPAEILDRKRKAFIVRSPVLAVAKVGSALMERRREMLSASLGIIDQKLFGETLARADAGQDVPVVGLLRVIALELWLESQQDTIPPEHLQGLSRTPSHKGNAWMRRTTATTKGQGRFA